jgi:hypothetical protein
MAVKAVFVGIDRHQHPDVPELGGARRDATPFGRYSPTRSLVFPAA